MNLLGKINYDGKIWMSIARLAACSLAEMDGWLPKCTSSIKPAEERSGPPPAGLGSCNNGCFVSFLHYYPLTDGGVLGGRVCEARVVGVRR